MDDHPFEIVMIEDNVDHAEIIQRALHDHQLANNILHFQDGKTALDYLIHRKPHPDTKQFVRPHLILLDLRMPKIDGLEVLKEIRAIPKFDGIPVVILTTSAKDKDIEIAYRYKANSYLIKPVNSKKFQELLNDLGFYWLVWNKSVIKPGTLVNWPDEDKPRAYNRSAGQCHDD